jgi:hypothetical protein
LKVFGLRGVNHDCEQSREPEAALQPLISAILDGMVTASATIIIAGYRLAMDRPNTNQSA